MRMNANLMRKVDLESMKALSWNKLEQHDLKEAQNKVHHISQNLSVNICLKKSCRVQVLVEAIEPKINSDISHNIINSRQLEYDYNIFAVFIKPCLVNSSI